MQRYLTWYHEGIILTQENPLPCSWDIVPSKELIPTNTSFLHMFQRKNIKMMCNNADVPWEVVWICQNVCGAI